MEIENGAGDGGFKAKVDGFNRVYTRGFNSTQAAHGVQIGQGFAATVDNALGAIAVPTAFDGTIFTIANTSSARPLLIETMIFSSSVAGPFLRYIQLPTLTSTTNKTAMIPVNMNFGSNGKADATVEFWDEVGSGIGGVSDGSKFQTIELATTPFRDFVNGFIRLEPGNTFSIECDNDTVGTANVSIDVRFFFEG